MIVRSPVQNSRGTFSEILFFFENSKLYTKFLSGAKPEICQILFRTVAKMHSTCPEEVFAENEFTWKVWISKSFDIWEKFFGRFSKTAKYVEEVLKKVKIVAISPLCILVEREFFAFDRFPTVVGVKQRPWLPKERFSVRQQRQLGLWT